MDDEFVFAELIEKTIRKVGNEYCVFSKKSGKNLGCSPSRAGAIKRLGQIEWFKNHKSLAEDEIVVALESGSLSATDEELKSFFGKSIVAEDENGTQNCSLVDEAKRNYLHYKSLFEEVKHLPTQHDQQSHAGGASRLGAISSVGQLLDDATSEFAKTKVDENWLDMQRSSDVLTRSALVDIVEYVAKQSDVKISNKDAQNIVDYNLKGIDKWTTGMKDFMGRGASDYPEPWAWRGDVNDDELKNSLAEQLQDYSEEKSTVLHADTGVKTELELAKRDRDIRGRHNAWSPEADKNIPTEDVVGKEKKVLPSEKINEEDTEKEDRYRAKSLIEKRVVEVTSMWKDAGRALRDLDKAECDYLNSEDDTKTLFLKSFYDKLATAFDRRFTKEDKQKPIVKHTRNESLYEFESSIRKHLAGRHNQHSEEKHLPNQHDQKAHAGMKGAAGKVSHTPAQLREAAARQHAKDTGMSLTEARRKVGSGIKVPTARVVNQFVNRQIERYDGIADDLSTGLEKSDVVTIVSEVIKSIKQ